MARLEVALVQGELLVGALRGHHAHGDVGITAQAAALAAVVDEVAVGDAHRHAGAAVAAVGAVDTFARPAESPVQFLRVESLHARVPRVEDQVARGSRGELTAWIRPGAEPPQALLVPVRGSAP